SSRRSNAGPKTAIPGKPGGRSRHFPLPCASQLTATCDRPAAAGLRARALHPRPTGRIVPMPCRSRLAPACLALAALTGSSPPPARADVEDRLYDFTDGYYKVNGVDPAQISGRRQADGVRAVTDKPNFKFQRNVRVLSTSPAYNHSGDIEFFAVLGGG